MAECKNCKKKYHCCGSCGEPYWAYYYCDTECMLAVEKNIVEQIAATRGTTGEQLISMVREVDDAIVSLEGLLSAWPR